nr:hypothetical protein [Tanacetum cinerariifolium]
MTLLLMLFAYRDLFFFDITFEIKDSDELTGSTWNIKGCGDTTSKGAVAGTLAGVSQLKERSFASLLRPKTVINKLHFRTLVNEEKVEGSDCVLPKDAANLVKCRYENSIVGFFVGKDPSFSVVQNFVLNTWIKFGFEKISRNDNGVYLFKFATEAGMEQVLERGPWMICKSPTILNKWSSGVSLKKGEVNKVLVWVKLYNVPGKINFAWALIEISLESTLKQEVNMVVPNDEDDRHTKEVIRVEYEWKPPHCVGCKTFGHGPNLCPKRVREDIPKASSMAAKSSNMEENEEGFVEVKSRKKNKGAASRSFGGLRLPKPNSKVTWQEKKNVGSKRGSNTASPSGSTSDNDKVDGGKSSSSRAKPALNTLVSNPFEVLNVVREDACDSSVQQPKGSDHAKENSKSKVSELEDESDEDEVYMSYGGGGHGDRLAGMLGRVYMISGDAKSWVILIYSLSYCTFVYCFEISAQLLGLRPLGVFSLLFLGCQRLSLGLWVMERGFIDSGVKKKKKEGDGIMNAVKNGVSKVDEKEMKDGGSLGADGSAKVIDKAPILSGIARRVTNIDGNTKVLKSILKKAVRNVGDDKNEAGKMSNVGGSPSKVLFEAVGDLRANLSTTANGDTDFNGPKTGGSFASLLMPNDAVNKYVPNTWRKFGFVRITRNDDGVYLFKFATKSGRDQVIDKGPWMICKSPIMLSKWSPSVSLKRVEVTKVPPIMLDAFTSSMFVDSWGRISFARALIEIDAAVGLKKEVIMAIPDEEGDGYIKE